MFSQNADMDELTSVNADKNTLLRLIIYAHNVIFYSYQDPHNYGENEVGKTGL